MSGESDVMYPVGSNQENFRKGNLRGNLAEGLAFTSLISLVPPHTAPAGGITIIIPQIVPEKLTGSFTGYLNPGLFTFKGSPPDAEHKAPWCTAPMTDACSYYQTSIVISSPRPAQPPIHQCTATAIVSIYCSPLCASYLTMFLI